MAPTPHGHLKGAVSALMILQNEMEDLAEEMLNRAGYSRYEISNYCRPGYASRHNSLHWTGGRYLGLGPSAQSYVDERRFGNVSNLAAYNQALLSGALPLSEYELLTPAEDSCERLVFGLRLTDGVSLEDTGALAFRAVRQGGRVDFDEILERGATGTADRARPTRMRTVLQSPSSLVSKTRFPQAPSH